MFLRPRRERIRDDNGREASVRKFWHIIPRPGSAHAYSSIRAGISPQVRKRNSSTQGLKKEASPMWYQFRLQKIKIDTRLTKKALIVCAPVAAAGRIHGHGAERPGKPTWTKGDVEAGQRIRLQIGRPQDTALQDMLKASCSGKMKISSLQPFWMRAPSGLGKCFLQAPHPPLGLAEPTAAPTWPVGSHRTWIEKANRRPSWTESYSMPNQAEAKIFHPKLGGRKTKNTGSRGKIKIYK